MNHDRQALERAIRAVQVLAILAGCLSAISYWEQRGSFWEDEIIAVTHGLEPLPKFFVEVARNDIHPFVYFLWVKLWSIPDPSSDTWVLASSLAGAFASAAVVAYAAYRERGRDAALWAAGLFCLVPTFTWSAGNLRMYGLMPAIAVGCWAANRDLLRNGGWWRVAALVTIQLVQTYIHAIGFFFAAFIALAALVEHRQRLDRHRLRLWGISQSLTLVGMLPVVASALLRGTEPLPPFSLFSLLLFPAQTVSVWGAASGALVIGGLTFIFLAAFGLSDRLGRTLVLVVPCGALLASILGSLSGKPMFKPPVFTANLVPFLALAAGFGLAECRTAMPRVFAAAGMAAMAVGLWTGTVERGTSGNYRPAALYVADNARSGDLVVIPTVSVFWGVMRYAVGPRWGEPLAVMPLRDPRAWEKLKGKLGPEWCRRLGLIPETEHVDSNGVRYVVGTDIGDNWAGRRGLWVVHHRNYQERGQEDLILPGPIRQASLRTFGDKITVSFFVPEGELGQLPAELQKIH